MIGVRSFILILGVRWSLTLKIYTNSWAVRVPAGSEMAERIANKLGFVNLGQVIHGRDLYHFQHRGLQKKSFTVQRNRQIHLKKEPMVQWFEQQTVKYRHKRQFSVIPTDPWFHKQWYLDPMASYDFNSNDPDPQPHYNPSDENRHGTRCAGEVAAAANNDICGAGIAYNSRIGGVRMLDGFITDIIEAKSLSLNPQHIHIFSASWGPEDNGKTVDGPGPLAKEAFYRGTLYGRGGLGSIFVWASGNGGLHYDNCNCDGYTNSIYTLSVGSTTENGNVPWYSEACASTLTTTFSSGITKERQIVTTDMHFRCTDQHTGTSASAPLAAGMIALALEANSALTWRDVQHIVVRASSPANLKAEDWIVNGVGRKVSHYYGYGLLDAGHLVDLAGKWQATLPQRRCLVKVESTPELLLPNHMVRQNVDGCAGSSNYIQSLEHVQVKISLSYSRRGDLQILLISPMGTRSVLVAMRPYDISTDGYKDWIFMSTHTWDENPQGTWTLQLQNKGDFTNTGYLVGLTFVFYGTEEDMMARKLDHSVLSECVTKDKSGRCHKCANPYYYAFRHLCLSYCPPKFFKITRKVPRTVRKHQSSNVALVCTSCHPSCYTCNGYSANNCTACPSFFSYDEKMNTCSQMSFPRKEKGILNSNHLSRTALIVILIIGVPTAFFLLLCIIWSVIKVFQGRHTTSQSQMASSVEMGSPVEVIDD
ncbi:hypothetical protein GDO86_000987 [Hymenochirus boettgeri]|uniref:P/Homo B domain-containing protein n=1 Tax=Hymenochirus boettgeri TaxID=247094 RepID=A0A8T2KGQ7_9PIPI|nr:hypothetical protein GDO86_000987 [Hymenochirus boettgeri]